MAFPCADGTGLAGGNIFKALELKKISKTYGSQKVLNNVSLTVGQGEILGLLGPNGAGKSTLMKIIVGLTKPDFGQINILGYDALKERKLIKPLISFVAQSNTLEREFTVKQVLQTYGQIFGVRDINNRLEEILSQFRLNDIRDKYVLHLSGGMARRLLIARAVLTGPRLLLLDEPTVGLDPDVRRDIWDIILSLSKGGTSVLFSTHYMDEAQQLCDKIALMRLGELVDVDMPANIIKKTEDTLGRPISLEDAFIRLLGAGKD